jgi:hypothetical protein
VFELVSLFDEFHLVGKGNVIVVIQFFFPLLELILALELHVGDFVLHLSIEFVIEHFFLLFDLFLFFSVHFFRNFRGQFIRNLIS